MIVIKKRTRILREPKPKATTNKAGVLLSISNQTDPGWLDELLTKRQNTYYRWSIKSAFVGMSVWIAESRVGISCYAKIGDINRKTEPIKVKLIGAEKVDIPITVEELRDLGIIKKNTPQTLQYLSEEQCKKLEDLFK
jgi:hypothetical protein